MTTKLDTREVTDDLDKSDSSGDSACESRGQQMMASGPSPVCHLFL